jgi:hypothetical protein
MLNCPRCGTSNEDDALVCRHCSTLLEAPAETPPPPPAGDAEPAATPTRTLGEAFELPAEEHDESGEEPQPPAASEDGETAESASAGDASEDPRHGGATDDRGGEPAAPAPRPAARRPRRGADGEGLDAGHLSAISHHQLGRPVISVIGFPSSGKTFLVNRWRKQLSDRGDWSSNQLYETRIPLSPEGLIDTVFTSNGGGAPVSYAVLDCAGESFDVAFARQRDEGEIAGQSARSYLAALALAGAYVFVIAAPEAVEARRRRSLEGFLYGFRDILSGILVAKRRLRLQSAEELLRDGISREELDGALDLRLRLDEPLVVAFAQADRLDSAQPAPEGHDHDPRRFAEVYAPALFHAVRGHFRRHRFAFVSAFAGFEAAPSGVPEPDYALPAHGTAAAFDWIDRRLRPRPPLVGRFGRLAAGVPAAHGEWLRRLVDPGFRRGEPR